MVKHIIEHFRKVDPILASVFERAGLSEVGMSTDYFSDLCEAIIQQQLSERAGDTIWNRFRKLCQPLTPDNFLRVSDKKIRDAGISWSKVAYLKNLARYAKRFDLGSFRDMSDADVIAELTKVKGIGPWTAEMFLMFSLGREDVFSFGDLGLRNAIKALYNFKRTPTRQQMEKIVDRWSPYKTWGARVLWKSLEI